MQPVAAERALEEYKGLPAEGQGQLCTGLSASRSGISSIQDVTFSVYKHAILTPRLFPRAGGRA
jgi:hypothetical protein